jgi:hypothetical protein
MNPLRPKDWERSAFRAAVGGVCTSGGISLCCRNGSLPNELVRSDRADTEKMSNRQRKNNSSTQQLYGSHPNDFTGS